MITTIIAATFAVALFLLLPLIVEIRNASRAFVIGRNKSIISAKPLSLEEQAKLKEYAILFGLDNNTVTDNRALLQMGELAAEYIGEEAVEKILMVSICGTIRTAFKVKLHVNSLIRATKLLGRQNTFTLLMSHLIGGDLDEEGTISI